MSITTDYVLSIWTLLSEPLKGLRKGIDVSTFLDASYV